MKNQKVGQVCSLFLLCFLSMNTLFAQKNQVETSKYERNSLSLHFLKFASGNSFSDQVLNSVKVSGKYDDNSLGSNVITINVSEPGISAAPLPKGAKAVNKVDAEAGSEFYALLVKNLYEQKIPNKILAKILINDQKVSTPDVLSQRGEYNATDAQVLKANASKEGASLLRNNGLENLLKNVYFIVTQTGAIKSEYSKTAKENMYSVSYKSYLIQIDLKDMLATNFMTDFWWTEPNEAKYNNFMNYKFPVKLISVTESAAVTSETKLELVGLKLEKKPKTQEEITKDLADQTVSDALTAHSANYDPFKVKTVVYTASPITAKIGKKEGLQIDDRYEVFENRMSESGEKSSVKMGYVRAGKVADNAKNADGNTQPSEFYKASARRVEKNMILKEVPEKGIQIGADVMFGSFNVEGTSYSFNAVGATADYVTHLFKGNRASVSAMTFKIDGVDQAYTFVAAEAKQIVQLNKLALMGSVGYLYDTKDPDNGAEKLSALTASFKIGLDFGKNFQINAGPRMFMFPDPIGTTTAFSLGIRFAGF
jgi:hypothetical protein